MPAPASNTLTPEHFCHLMQSLLPDPPHAVAVAVSGGADSMALCLLAQSWARARGVALHALTVNHGLRAESADEAHQVHEWLAAKDIPHHILHWQGDKPESNTQAAARDARYDLMAEWCAEHHITHLLLAHHRDDQAETFLIRLGRGSGVDGLAAMQPHSTRNNLHLLRPLLDVDKTQLITYLQDIGQQWVEDPSNHDQAYTRSRMRALAPALQEAGISAVTLADTAKRMTRVKDYLHQQTTAAMTDCLIVHEAGYILLDQEMFRRLHDEIALRVLARAIGLMNGSTYRPRFSELKGLFDALGTPRTLAGCKFEPAGDKWLILREPAAIALPLTITIGEQTWDNRFRIRCSQPIPDVTVAALGEAGRAYLREAGVTLTALPATALLTLPALWHLEKPISVPHIGYRESEIADAIHVDRLGHLGYT